MTICDGSCDPECFACSVRRKGLQVAPSAMPNRHNRKGFTPPPPTWEKGTITETRCDGSRMPLFEPGTRSPLHVKQYGENRRSIEEQRRNLKTRTSPLPDV